jgi:hypothetical protein
MKPPTSYLFATVDASAEVRITSMANGEDVQPTRLEHT